MKQPKVSNVKVTPAAAPAAPLELSVALINRIHNGSVVRNILEMALHDLVSLQMDLKTAGLVRCEDVCDHGRQSPGARLLRGVEDKIGYAELLDVMDDLRTLIVSDAVAYEGEHYLSLKSIIDQPIDLDS